MAANVVRSTTNTAQALVGRRAECARLDQLLADARTGTSAAVVGRGEAGGGESAPLGDLLVHAGRCRGGGGGGAGTPMGVALPTLPPPFFSPLHELARLPGPH